MWQAQIAFTCLTCSNMHDSALRHLTTGLVHCSSQPCPLSWSTNESQVLASAATKHPAVQQLPWAFADLKSLCEGGISHSDKPGRNKIIIILSKNILKNNKFSIKPALARQRTRQTCVVHASVVCVRLVCGELDTPQNEALSLALKFN